MAFSGASKKQPERQRQRWFSLESRARWCLLIVCTCQLREKLRKHTVQVIMEAEVLIENCMVKKLDKIPLLSNLLFYNIKNLACCPRKEGLYSFKVSHFHLTTRKGRNISREVMLRHSNHRRSSKKTHCTAGQDKLTATT